MALEKDPVGPFKVTVPARRTIHIWFNNLEDPEIIPLKTDYSNVIMSDVPIVVQYNAS